MKLELGLNVGIANEAYHADRTAVSSTWLKIIDSYSPYHLRCYLDTPPEGQPSPALAMGSAVDCLIFEPEVWDEQFIVAPALDRRTTAGKEKWAELLADGRTIILQKDHAEALATAKAIRTNPRMADILKDGIAQPVFVWQDPVTGLLCKCKLDWYQESSATPFDLKTAVDASPVGFSRAVGNYGYHIQSAFYADGVRACGYAANDFIFAVQEKPSKNAHTTVASPNLMAYYRLTDEDQDAGRDAYSSALSAISFCMANDEWGGYTNETVTITRPTWAKKTDMESVTTL